MRIWVWPLAGTLLVLGYLGLAATEDISYRCEDPPIVRLFDPEPERPEGHFFDAGTHCNRGARTRARQMAAAGGLGASATVLALVAGRRFGTRPVPDPGAGETDPFKRPVRSRPT